MHANQAFFATLNLKGFDNDSIFSGRTQKDYF